MFDTIIPKDEGKEAPEEPITLKQVKDYMRVDHAHDDDAILIHIAAAREIAEAYLGISLVHHHWQACYRKVLPTHVELPYGPIRGVQSISAWVNNKEITLHPSRYQLCHHDEGILQVRQAFQGERIHIHYDTGYKKDEIPKGIIHGLMAHVNFIYDFGYDAKGLPPVTLSHYAPFRTRRFL